MPKAVDRWSVWWSRFLQVLGAAIIMQQAFIADSDRKWLLFVAFALTLGTIGVELVVRFAVRRLGEGSSDES